VALAGRDVWCEALSAHRAEACISKQRDGSQFDMDSELASLVRDWHDFYALVGTAAATLVGLMFVAASIGSGIFSEKHLEPMKAFITPTVVHFSAALFICILATIPTQTFTTRGLLVGCGGFAGLVYSGQIWVRIFSRFGSGIDFVDRTFYALIPVLGYLLATVSAAALLVEAPWAPDLMAVALIALLLAGIRNAWDMTLWIVTRSIDRESQDQGDSAS